MYVCNKHIYAYTYLLIYSYTHPLIHSYTHTLIHSYTHALIHSYTHTLVHSYTHTLIHSYHTVRHLEYPVSDKEVERNNRVYRFQGNRNPFIDHPEWVYGIWGLECGDIEQHEHNNDDVMDDSSIHEEL